MQALTLPALPRRSRGCSSLAASAPSRGVEASQTLIIDPRDTLFDATVGRRWLYQQLAFRGQAALPLDEFFRPWDQVLRQQVYLGKLPYWQSVNQFLRDQGLTAGHADELTRAAKAQFPELEAGGKLHPVVLPILSVLASYGVRSVAVVNASLSGEDFQETYFPAGSEVEFEAVYSSIDLANTHDQAGALGHLRERLGEETWQQRPYLISTCETSRQAAQAAGLRTLGISHTDPSPAVDHHLNTWADLIPFFASSSGS